MTSKEIAMGVARDIVRSCDTALGYGAWQYIAEQHVGSAFSAARVNRKMVTAVADEIVKCTFSMSQRFGECMCMAVGSVCRTGCGSRCCAVTRSSGHAKCWRRERVIYGGNASERSEKSVKP